jgi:chemotaxis protein MotB
LSDEPLKNIDKSLYPNQEAENEDDDSWQVSYLDIITILLGFLVILLSFSELNNGESFSVSELFKSSQNESEFITTPIDNIKEELENLLAPEIEEGKLEIFRELNDVRIRFKSDDLYNSGSAQLQDGATEILNRLLAAFKLISYDDFEIDIEGHTDNVPISSSSFSSNWELSTSRASNVVRYFNRMGISSDRLKASGYADSRPLVEFDQFGNPYPASKDKNRRVVLRLYYSRPEQYAESINDSTDSTDIPVDTTSQQSRPELVPDENDQNEDTIISESNLKTIGYEDGCRYSIQVGGFESFTNSFNFSTEAEAKTGLKFEILYNNTLFSSRTASSNSFLETISQQDVIYNEFGRDQVTGFIQQCYDDGTKRPQPLTYQIQLGFFRNQQNAISLSESLDQEHDIQTVIEPSSNNGFIVLTSSIKDISTTQNTLKYIREISGLSGAFIKYESNSISQYYFTFQIQLGSFETKQEIDALVEELREELGVQSSIKTFSNGRYYLVTRPYTNWDEISRLYRVLKSEDYQLFPVIYLLEQV